MASLFVLVCPQCKESFQRLKREVVRSRRLGRPAYCGLSCAQKAHARVETRTCPCGVQFEVKARKRAARHCSLSCASHFSMTPERREAQRKGGRLGAQRFLAQQVDPQPNFSYPSPQTNQ